MTLLKETDTYRDQLTRICREKELLELQVQQTMEQRDQAITDRAWFSFNVPVLIKNACIFCAGVATCYLCHRVDLTEYLRGKEVASL